MGIEMKDWDFDWEDRPDEEKQDRVKSRALKRYEQNIKTHQERYRQLSDMTAIPKPGEQYLIVTEKKFNAFTIISGVVEKGIIDEMYLAVYRTNQSTTNAIIDYINNGKILRGAMIISNFFQQTVQSEKWTANLVLFTEEHPRFKVAFVQSHAKVIALRAGSNHYVLEGSGNMTQNAMIEQYRYENSKEVFNFHKQWITELTDAEKEI